MMLNKIAVVTGAASGIGRAIVHEFARQGAKLVGAVDMDPAVKELESPLVKTFVGNTTDESFRKSVFDEMCKIDVPSCCVPAAGITRDSLAVKLNKETGKADIYSVDTFKTVLDVNLIAPIYWGLEMVARIAETKGKWTPGSDLRGTVIFIGSVSSLGNKGQVAYAATKKALVAAASTLTKEAMFYGVRFCTIHPGYTRTPMVMKMDPAIIEKFVLPQTQLKRLVTPEEIANAVWFVANNAAVNQEIWVDGGWHPAP